MSQPLFPTISGSDWTRQLRLARSTPNQVRRRIREIISQRKLNLRRT
jgi:hypothetical protein